MFGNQLMFPKYLMMDHDVVFVSMNYRLGILGNDGGIKSKGYVFIIPGGSKTDVFRFF